VILTASGGPFRTWGAKETYDATPEQALKHPTWTMGPKVTVDSASLMNKALEVIEAHWLFGLGADRIGVLIHPQSVVHAIVEFADGSSLAQLGAPDMRTPIQYALERACGGGRSAGMAKRIGWEELGRLEFSVPDPERFPALGLAYRAIREGGTAGAVLNGANEAAVEAFLGGRIRFGRIGELVRDAMDAVPAGGAGGLETVLDAGERARAFVRGAIA
jgi:1-deoxy-D-xylulose-5-phosphate reductoisomerase